jgi:trans-aconitate 2-methyltransferase
MNAGPRDWDAETYDRVSDPQFGWGLEVLERLELEGGETALDAGVGSGRVTEHLIERLPQGRVIALDGSQAMIGKAREKLGDRVSEYLVMDLAELEVAEPVDVVFSTATFHWLIDHDNLFRRIHDSLAPGGRLHAQCGGAGNVAAHGVAIGTVGNREPFAEHFQAMPAMWNFSSAEETAERLTAAGFEDVETSLEPKPVVPPHPGEYIRTVTVGPHLHHLPEELRAPFVEAIVEEMEKPVTLDYVRLNMAARRPA